MQVTLFFINSNQLSFLHLLYCLLFLGEGLFIHAYYTLLKSIKSVWTILFSIFRNILLFLFLSRILHPKVPPVSVALDQHYLQTTKRLISQVWQAQKRYYVLCPPVNFSMIHLDISETNYRHTDLRSNLFGHLKRTQAKSRPTKIRQWFSIKLGENNYHADQG